MRFFVVWLVSGALAGGLSGLAFREGQRAGAISRLTLGCAGALVGGWLCRRLGILTPDNLAGHLVVALIGAVALLVVLRATYRVWGFVPKPSWVGPYPGADLETPVRRLRELERRVFSSVLGRRQVSRDPNRLLNQGTRIFSSSESAVRREKAKEARGVLPGPTEPRAESRPGVRE